MNKTIAKQKKQFLANVTDERGEPMTVVAVVSHDDSCKNGHNTFSITGKIGDERGFHSFGCVHKEIAKYLPELAPFIKWHLTSTEGPLHYVANTIYHVQQRNLDYARSTAVWPDATDEDLLWSEPELTAKLMARLPALMAEFKTAVMSLGFTY